MILYLLDFAIIKYTVFKARFKRLFCSTRQRMSEEQLLKSFLGAPNTAWISACYEVVCLFVCVLFSFMPVVKQC